MQCKSKQALTPLVFISPQTSCKVTTIAVGSDPNKMHPLFSESIYIKQYPVLHLEQVAIVLSKHFKQNSE
jgi:hypothetical protein